MRAQFEFTSFAVALLVTGAHAAEIVPTSRLSEVKLLTANLGNPDATLTSTDLSAPFDETLAGDVVHSPPGGALNSGLWNITQARTISAQAVSCAMSQIAVTTTDFDSPVIFPSSRFEFNFTVDADTTVELDGQQIGNTSVGQNDFTRVQLLRNGASLFNSGTFPFRTLLSPGFAYTLKAQVSGEAEFNGATSSLAEVTMTLLLDGDGDGIGSLCDPDLDNDCDVDFVDLGLLKTVFFSSDPNADLDGDGNVSFGDLGVMKSLFFGAPGPSGVPDLCD